MNARQLNAYEAGGAALEAKSIAGFSPAQVRALTKIMGVMDLSGMDIASLPLDTQIEIAASLQSQVASATTLLNTLLGGHATAIAEIKARCLAEIQTNGGAKLAHDTFDVDLHYGADKPREKRLSVLLQLRDALPTEEFQKAVFVKKIDVKGVTPEAIDAIVAAGAKLEYDADGITLNKLQKQYGLESPQGKIIAEGYLPAEHGAPYVTITPRESAMKRVGAV